MAKNPAPEATTTAGRVSGAWKEDGDIAVFRGIPYAAPPVGDLRWRPPTPAPSWDGVRKATKDGPMAIQRGVLIEKFMEALLAGHGWSRAREKALAALVARVPMPAQSEDCLHLTVRTPAVDPGAKLPVMVWIHGGDHQDGSSTEVFYASNALASLGVVTVAINYRLGLMGYFAHPELAGESVQGVSGNYGTLDQVAALEWVQDNIAAFGGDPDNITIFGESAGGESVMHLMTAPLARGLFHRAIAQSPANSGQMIHLRKPFLNFDAAEDTGVTFAAALGITGSDQLSRMRERSVDELYALVRAAERLGDHFPVIDGHVLPESPLAAFAGGRQAPVPMIIGSNADEGSLILPALGAPMVEYRHQPQSIDGLQPEIVEAFGDDIGRLVDLYPGLDRRDQAAEIDFMGDHMFGARAYWYARHHQAAGNPTWLYHFARTPPAKKQTAGAFHAAELPFVHGSSVPILPMTADDKVLGAEIRRNWTAFAATGAPAEASGVAWPAFDRDDPRWLRFNHLIEAEAVPLVQKYEILNARTQRLVDAMSAMGAEAMEAAAG